jgi:glucose-6-phosphate isomerase
MTSKPIEPISYVPTGVYLKRTGLSQQDLPDLAPRLNAARDEVLADLEWWNSGLSVPPEKQPLDAGFIDLPDRLLAEYRRDGQASELGQIIATAREVSELVDRFVVLGIGGSYMGARAIFEACCHPYHNELSRADRGGWPRIYFDGNNLDNDFTHGLLDVLGRRAAQGVEDRWAMAVISKSGGTLETAVAFRLFLRAMRTSCAGDQALLAKLILPVTGRSGKLHKLATALDCDPIFTIPDGVGGRFSVFTAAGLLPAAIMGLDLLRLLEGAAAMNARFRAAPVGENPVLDYVGVAHLMEERQGATIRILSAWANGLEALGLWYDQLLSESLGKQGRGATPLTVVNSRDLHSRGQQHQEGRRDKLITNLIVGEVRRDRLKAGRSDLNHDELNSLEDKTMPELLQAAIEGTNQAYRDDGRPTADVHLPRLDEATLGQLLQMLMLATVVEGRLIGINPYGQPGVEAYKRNMTAILSRDEE